MIDDKKRQREMERQVSVWDRQRQKDRGLCVIFYIMRKVMASLLFSLQTVIGGERRTTEIHINPFSPSGSAPKPSELLTLTLDVRAPPTSIHTHANAGGRKNGIFCIFFWWTAITNGRWLEDQNIKDGSHKECWLHRRLTRFWNSEGTSSPLSTPALL